MKFHLYILLLFIFINFTPFHLYAQNIGTSLTIRVSHPSPTPTIIIRDSASRSTIAGAHIQLIHKKDTTWGISNNNGKYVFEKNYMGEVELKVSCLGYKSFEKKLSRTDLKQEYPILLVEDVLSISQIVVVGEEVAMVIDGDTTIFNAASFKTMDHENLGTLLSKFPGIVVNERGLSYNGESIKKIYIDGQMFFGDDTSSPLTHLYANDVKRVKVYEEENSIAARLGDKNRHKDKVMDVVTHNKPKLIKNIMATGGLSLPTNGSKEKASSDNITKNTKLGQFIGSRFGIFKPNHNFHGDASYKKDYSDILIPSNSNSRHQNLGGNISYTYRQGDSLNIKTTNSYSNRTQMPEDVKSTIYLPSEGILIEKSLSNNSQHLLSSMFSSRNSFHISRDKNIFDTSLDLGFNKTDNQSKSTANTIYKDGSTINNIRENSGDMTSYDINGKLAYTRSIREGEYFDVGVSYKRSKSNSYTWQVDTLGTDSFKTLLNNYGDGHSSNLTTYIKYNWNLDKIGKISLSYDFEYKNIHSTQLSTDYLNDPLGEMDKLRSYDYTVNSMAHSASLDYTKRLKKLYINFSLIASLENILRDELAPIKNSSPRNFFNIRPNLDLNFKKFGITYKSSSSPISIESLRNYIDEANPMYLRAGNPDLKQEIRHNINGYYIIIRDPKKASDFIIRFGANLKSNHAAQKTEFFNRDTTLANYNNYEAKAGSNLSTIVSTDGYYSLMTDLNYSVRSKLLKSTVKTNLGWNFTNTPFFIGDVLNNTRRSEAKFEVGLMSSFSRTFKLDIFSKTGLGQINSGDYGINKYLREKVNLHSQLAFLDNYLAKINAVYNLYINDKSNNFSVNECQMGLSIGRFFGKKKSLLVELGISEIFNPSQNRTIIENSNYIQTREIAIIGRSVFIKAMWTL